MYDIENITESMTDRNGDAWYQVLDGMTVYRVECYATQDGVTPSRVYKINGFDYSLLTGDDVLQALNIKEAVKEYIDNEETK